MALIQDSPSRRKAPLGVFSLGLAISFKFCNDIQRAYEKLDGRQQCRFAKQVSLYVKMLQNKEDIL